MLIARSFGFEAAHRLPFVPEGHKCGRLHGHSYTATVAVMGSEAGDGMVVDFGELDELLRPIRDQLDHHYLNEVPGLENPTSEIIARWIYGRLVNAMPEGVAIAYVEVSETPRSMARFPR